MEIEIRKIDKYREVIITEGNAEIVTGLLDQKEAYELIEELQRAIYDLRLDAT